MGIIAIIMISLFSFNAHATCTPTPDCASIGYTETSCETDYLACPFDSTKLKCIPCDSSFRYDCSGENITGGDGDTCAGKYAKCTCEDGLPFNKGICPQSCKVSMIYYSDKSCSDELDSSKTPIGVIVKANELVMSNITSVRWGAEGTEITNTTETNGKENTIKISEIHSNIGLNASSSAAIYCNEYSTIGTNAGDWYLPAINELNLIYGNKSTLYITWVNKLSWGSNLTYTIWSSTETNSNQALWIDSNNGSIYALGKTVNFSVTCFLPI